MLPATKIASLSKSDERDEKVMSVMTNLEITRVHHELV